MDLTGQVVLWISVLEDTIRFKQRLASVRIVGIPKQKDTEERVSQRGSERGWVICVFLSMSSVA